MSSQRLAARKAAKQGGATDATSGPEERLVQVLDKVGQGILEVPPQTYEELPSAVMQVLCLLHPRYKDHAEFRGLQAEERRLKEEVESLKTKKPDSRGRRIERTPTTNLERKGSTGKISSAEAEGDQLPSGSKEAAEDEAEAE
mmetsp:Transcript_74740/g.120673  ORF Transcript_74740/g.120673 Transcript_74740/m.120673 type:complete len:143 (+) Transcript_74740:101-529(+)|eukprot:CAMPEP_0115096298 /NCGR_PEP_ID=MMETSP0227-20121206/29631_1 /TAXON_ID=89957 /ORGANISM="Polarella glacialis, Strain CCMP 1383" /LENGTH=142 /DNA_ID=CAMNT_0002489987 /DNA_START=64 /DNA_END=492 /DNA_ORIENTATION=-